MSTGFWQRKLERTAQRREQAQKKLRVIDAKLEGINKKLMNERVKAWNNLVLSDFDYQEVKSKARRERLQKR